MIFLRIGIATRHLSSAPALPRPFGFTACWIAGVPETRVASRRDFEEPLAGRSWMARWRPLHALAGTSDRHDPELQAIARSPWPAEPVATVAWLKPDSG